MPTSCYKGIWQLISKLFVLLQENSLLFNALFVEISPTYGFATYCDVLFESTGSLGYVHLPNIDQNIYLNSMRYSCIC